MNMDKSKVPAQAFAQLYPKDLAPGGLFRFRGSWALRVAREADFHAFLMLEGERAGDVFELAEGMAEEVAIVQPFGWFPMMSLTASPTQKDDWPLTLALTEAGPAIVGAYSRNDWTPRNLAFSPKGECIETVELYRTARFDQWSVEVCHIDRPYQSLGTLLQIDRRSK